MFEATKNTEQIKGVFYAKVFNSFRIVFNVSH